MEKDVSARELKTFKTPPFRIYLGDPLDIYTRMNIAHQYTSDNVYECYSKYITPFRGWRAYGSSRSNFIRVRSGRAKNSG